MAIEEVVRKVLVDEHADGLRESVAWLARELTKVVTIPPSFRAHLLWEMTSSSEPRASTSRALHRAVLRQPIVNQPATSGGRSRGSSTANRRNWAICRVFRTVGRRFELRTFCVLQEWHPTRRKCRFAGLSKR
jgi:hypothetical protein